MTVGNLIEFINKNNIPMDAKILSQRIEDEYFENHGWESFKKKGELYHQKKEWNEKVKNGKIKEEYPDIPDELIKEISDEEIENFMEQYYEVWCPIKYSNDNNIYLNGHI